MTGWGSYFYLSYAHSAPLAGSLDSEPDRWVRRFFDDLAAAVADRATTAMRPGFFDHVITPDANWKATLTRALGSAEVFVPLYSPGYFAKSWPGREWACFHTRMARAGLVDPLRRFVPVLWAPLREDEDRPGVDQAIALSDEPDYRENGLSALSRLAPFHDLYQSTVIMIAKRVVALAEDEPIGASPAPDIDDVESAFPPLDSQLLAFEVAVVASPDWEPFPEKAGFSPVDFAVRAAEQLDFAVRTTRVEDSKAPSGALPGIVLIDPLFVANEEGEQRLRSFVEDLPSWVLPLIVCGPESSARGTTLRDRVLVILEESNALRTEVARKMADGVESPEAIDQIISGFVTEAERQYLRHSHVPHPVVPPRSRPRLASPPDPSAEGFDA